MKSRADWVRKRVVKPEETFAPQGRQAWLGAKKSVEKLFRTRWPLDRAVPTIG